MTPVALTRCGSYTQPELDASIARVLGAVALPNLRAAHVLLKPNLISAKHGPLACTEGAFILAVARWLLAQGARVSIGDSPAFGTAAMALRMLGIADELAACGVASTNFSSGRKLRLPNGGSAVLAEAALDCDLLVNLPRVKAHAQTRVTLAVKNCFGCVVGLRKSWWHMRHGGPQGDFSDRLAQLPALLPPILTVLDGVTAMHMTGPLRGEPYPLGLVGAANTPVAMDAALHEIIALAPERSPVMAACRRADMPGARLEQLSFPLAAPAELRTAGFVVPDELNPIRFSFFRYLKSTVYRLRLQRRGPL
ncbi:DUF362 domain-containing protein [Candidatus Electronema sp. JM]|uniref:DUF362 domain-containing protein n=1 Tax=Candidatus Electronema sp. JM TaxID=3401571 RepID=UPI003AA870FC